MVDIASLPQPCGTSPRRLMLSFAVALGILCHHTLASSDNQQPVPTGQDVWGGEKLLSRWREMLSARADKGEPALSAFEQAFTATYTSKDSSEVSRTLEQFSWLTHWIDKNPQPNATQLAFIPEFSNSSVLAVARAGVALAKRDNQDVTSMLADLNAISVQLRSLSPWHGYPATRRVLLGALLQRRVGFGGRFPADIEAAVDDILLQLFRLHKVSAANRGAVQFFHISKSGGTNLCQAAEANGCSSQGFDTKTNCLIRGFSDQPRWVTYSAHKFLQHRMSDRQALPWFVNFHSYRPDLTCEQRRAYLALHNLTFYANEYTNPPGFESTSRMCDDFVNLIMFRHPAERLRSQVGWVQKLYKEYYADVDTRAAFLNRTTGFWERLLPAGVNNYYIRSLLGQRFFEFPVTQVGPEHVAQAQLAASSHDLLLLLEATDRSALALHRGLGWAVPLRQAAVRSSAELGESAALPLDWEALLDRNAPDVQLYGFVREMQALDSLLWAFADVADAELGGGSSASAEGVAPAAGAAASNGTSDAAAAGASARCGYVSSASPVAVAERLERLRGVALPEALLAPPPPPQGAAGDASVNESEGNGEERAPPAAGTADTAAGAMGDAGAVGVAAEAGGTASPGSGGAGGVAAAVPGDGGDGARGAVGDGTQKLGGRSASGSGRSGPVVRIRSVRREARRMLR